MTTYRITGSALIEIALTVEADTAEDAEADAESEVLRALDPIDVCVGHPRISILECEAEGAAAEVEEDDTGKGAA
jgi:hypothetical protein